MSGKNMPFSISGREAHIYNTVLPMEAEISTKPGSADTRGQDN